MNFSNFISDLRSTSKPSEKQELLMTYHAHDFEILEEILKACYDPFRLFHVKIQPKEIPAPGQDDFDSMWFQILNHLKKCEQSNSNKENRERTVELLSLLDQGAQELLVGILNKNFKAGLGHKNVLKVFPGIVQTFEVQLANTYKEEKDYGVGGWFVTPKLDGVRCVALRLDGEWKCYSRQGKEFLTVDHIKKQLEYIYQNYSSATFYDGELYKHGLKFEEIQGAVMSYTQGTAKEIEYHVFMTGHAEDFLAQKLENFNAAEGWGCSLDNIKCVQQYYITNDLVYETLEKYFEEGYEGIMLRKPGHNYDFKRSDNLLKLKEGKDSKTSEETTSDALVLDIVKSAFPIIENGEMHYEDLLTKLIVLQQDGVQCSVGSGYDLPFRRTYTEAPENLIGKVIEVKHQGKGKQGRMRFPRFYRMREDLEWEN